MSSTWGERIQISIFGGSHTAAIGVNIDGLPAGEPIDWAEILAQMARRAPGQDPTATRRREADQPRVLCGLLAGLLYRAFVRLLPGRDKLCCVLGGLCAPLLNTLLFMGSMVAFFYNMDFVQAQVAKLGAANPLMFVILSVGLQGALEAVICTVVAAAVTIPLKKFLHD